MPLLLPRPRVLPRHTKIPKEGERGERTVIEEETTARPEFGALRRAIEGRDADTLIGFYSDDAELRVLNGDALGGPAFELRGRAQMERYLRAVCEQEMTCLLLEGEPAFGRGSVSFGSTCEYPGGTRVSVTTTLELDGEGRILRHTDVAQSARSDVRANDEHETASRVGVDRRNEKGRE
jgi:ketosteroid isomerase-like protein